MDRLANQLIRVLFGSLFLMMGAAQGASEDGSISEVQKKKAVYRMYDDHRKDFPGVKDISVPEAMEMLEHSTVVFVDTRKPDEMAVSMLPAAVSRKDFLNHLDRYRHKTVVGYCTISYRSGLFAREMAESGVTVLNLRGGILAWLLEGGAVYDKDGNEVRRVHVYGDKWDYAPAGYESVKFSLWEQLF